MDNTSAALDASMDAILDAPVTDDTPVVDDTAPDTPISDDAPASGDDTPTDGQVPEGADEANTDGTADTNVDGTPGDGRTIPSKWKELFKGDKELKSLFFSHAEFKKHFESPAKAKEFLQDLEAAGGVDALKQSSVTLQEIDTAIAAGDPKIVEKFAAAEGFTKLVPSVLEAYAKSDEAGYTHLMAGTIHDTLLQSGFLNGMETLKNLVADNPQAKELVAKMASVLGGVTQLAKSKPEAPKLDPERERLTKDREAFETEKKEAFRKDIGTSVASTITSGIKTNLTPYLKGRQTSTEDYALLEKNVNLELGALLTADATFQRQKDALLKTGDKAKIVACMENAIAKHLPAAAKKVGRLFGSAQAPKVTKKEAPPATNGAVQKVSATPQHGEVDWSRTTDDMFLDGEAWLKTGRKVKFD